MLLEFKEICFEKYIPEVVAVPLEETLDNLFSARFPPEKKDLVMRFIIKSGYRFSPERDFAKLITCATEFAERGYRFTMPEIKALRNPNETFNLSIAHYMVGAGHRFLLSELLEFGNQINIYQETLAHRMAWNGYVFTIPELLLLGNPYNSNKISIAHVMAAMGHKFSLADMEQLGYPKDPDGDTPIQVMGRSVPNSKPSAQLVFVKDVPTFICKTKSGTDHSGMKMDISFGWFNERENEFAAYDDFYFSLQKDSIHWRVIFSEGSEARIETHLYYKAVIQELAEQLNEALAKHQDVDFLLCLETPIRPRVNNELDIVVHD